MSDNLVLVALACVARVRDGRAEVLVARRGASGPLPGLWEFPGGKVEKGETVEHAARREALEELGLAIDRLVPLVEVTHRYDHAVVRLHAFGAIVSLDAAPRPLASIECRWVPAEALESLEWPAANAAIVERVRTWMGALP